MRIKCIFLVFAMLTIIGCQKNEKTKQLVKDKQQDKNVLSDNDFNDFKKSNYFDSDRVMEAKYKVMKNGDKFAYSDLVLFYSYNKSKSFEILPYSLIMVEKHKKYDYCSNVFQDLLAFYTGKELGDYFNGSDSSLVDYLKNMEKLNISQKEYANCFLILGAKNKDIISVSYLEIIYRKGLGVGINMKKADSLKGVYKQLRVLDSISLLQQNKK